MRRLIIPIILALILGGVVGGVIVNADQTKQAKVVNVQEYIEPYYGIGAYVLKSGTLIEGEYKGPESIVGTINRPGTWVIRKIEVKP